MNAGIWMDRRNAIIVLCDDSSEEILEVESDVEEFNLHGGYGGARKDLPQDAQSDKKLLARKQLQTQKYFRDIISRLPELQELYVFGPGDARKQFIKEVKSDYVFENTEVTEEPAEQMTLNQLRSQVRDFFGLNNLKTDDQTTTGTATTISVEHEFVNIPVSDPIEIMVNEKLEKLRKKFPMLIRAKAYYKLDKSPDNRNMLCEMELSIPGQNLFAQSRSEEMVKAVAEVLNDLRRQLKRRKEIGGEKVRR